MWNRGGEPFLVDPLSPKDRKKNAHAFVVGPTGAGKSALLNTLLRHQLAIHRPRLFIFDPVGGFDLFADDMARAGLSVHRITINRNEDVTLPPFANAFAVLDERDAYAAREALTGDTHERWHANADVDDNGQVNVKDLLILLDDFGQECG